MQPRLKSDLPITSEIISWLQSVISPKQPESSPAPLVAPSSAISGQGAKKPAKPVSYELKPLCYAECSTDDISSGVRSDVGVNIRRFSSPFNISIALPSVMSLQPEQKSASASRKRLSDAGSNKPKWLTQLPMLTADHSITYNSNVQKLMFKANLDLNSQKYSGEVTWFAKWEGQPAKLKFRWSEGGAHNVLYDMQMAIRQSAHKIRLTGHPHQLHSASLILGPATTQGSTPGFDTQPLVTTSSSSGRVGSTGTNSSRFSGSSKVASRGSSSSSTSAGTSSSSSRVVDDDSSSITLEQPVMTAFDQSGLQYELGWNLQQNSPVLSATRRFSSNSSSTGGSSCWGLKQVKAAYDGKSNALSLSAAGGCWNFGMLFPTEASGPLGLPKPSSAGLWPRVLLTLTPDLALQ